MAWQTPKTNWGAADGVRNTDMNRIEENILELRNQAMLAGVYQLLMATKAVLTSQSLVVNPIPTAWTAVSSPVEYVSSAYRIKANASTPNQQAYLAFDSSIDTPAVITGTEAWLQIELPEPLLVDKFKVKFSASEAHTRSIKIQGSNDGLAWSDVWVSPDNLNISTLTEISASNPGVYKYYRMHFTSTANDSRYIYSFQFSDYTITTYRVSYILALSGDLNKGQRLLIETPTNYSAVGVTQNTLNSLAIDGILLPGTKYELAYNGSGFNIVEVI